ncbi:pitrilysin family protein [soil metagenome]
MHLDRKLAAPLVSLAMLGLAAVSPARADNPPLYPGVTSFVLDNGMQVVVIPDHRAPVVTHMVWYKVGAADDPPGKSGIAHFLEHLMFKRTATYGEGEFSARVAAYGGNDNAFTTSDVTVYHQTIARERLGTMMGFEADRMVNLVIDDAALIPERQVILEERRMRIDSSPGSRLGEAMDAALFENSHYGIPVIGWEHEMATLDREDALAQYARYYMPNNAVLVVAGDVTPEEVRKLADTTYGKIPRRADLPPRIRLKEPPQETPRVVTLTDARVTQPSFRRAYLVPSVFTAAPGEAEALDVLAEVLDGGSTARLNSQLVRGKGIAVSAGAGYGSIAVGETQFSLSGTPRGDVSASELAAAFDAVIAELIEKGVTTEELDRAKRRVRSDAVYRQDNPSGLANSFGAALADGGSIDLVRSWPDRIAAVTGAQVVAAAGKYLDIRRSVTGYLMPEAEKRS